MRQERKVKSTYRVIGMFEPDRMASVNLQFAYEEVMPTEQYRLLSSKQGTEKSNKELLVVEEVSV
jgi:hypothetical protein